MKLLRTTPQTYGKVLYPNDLHFLNFFLRMAYHKTEAFGPIENELAEFAKALGHPARIAILKELARRNSCVCGEIVEVLPLAQSTVSQHLKELKEAGLILGSVEGTKSCYCINWETFKRFGAVFNEFFNQTEQTGGCC